MLTSIPTTPTSWRIVSLAISKNLLHVFPKLPNRTVSPDFDLLRQMLKPHLLVFLDECVVVWRFSQIHLMLHVQVGLGFLINPSYHHHVL